MVGGHAEEAERLASGDTGGPGAVGSARQPARASTAGGAPDAPGHPQTARGQGSGVGDYYRIAAEIVKWDDPSVEGVPAHLVPGLRRFIDEGQLPGDFLRAVLENDLKATVARADPESLAGLRPLLVFMHCVLPAGCWGSPLRVSQWAKGVRAQRRAERS